MALPPQIAVPVEIRNAGRVRTDNSQPSSVPRLIANEMLMSGVEKAALTCLDDFLQVHAEAKADDSGLQQQLGSPPGRRGIRMRGDRSKEESGEQSQWRRSPRRQAKNNSAEEKNS